MIALFHLVVAFSTEAVKVFKPYMAQYEMEEYTVCWRSVLCIFLYLFEILVKMLPFVPDSVFHGSHVLFCTKGAHVINVRNSFFQAVLSVTNSFLPS